MQQPTLGVTRVHHEPLEAFVYNIARRIDISDPHATLLARLLIASDLRGILSHGSFQMVRYAREIGAGQLNPKPVVQVTRESSTTLVIDGDGGLGYFPAYDGARRLIEKAKQHGMAAMVTRDHGHIGAAGHYTRLAAEADMIAFTTSGVQLQFKPGDPVQRAGGGSPMSFCAPADQEPPLLVDVGVMHEVHRNAQHVDELGRLAPGVILRAIAFGTICQAWGGLLAGIPIDADRANRRYAAANQGAMMFALKISLFADPQQFKHEIDEYARRVRQLKPVEGTEGAFLPGSIEADREARYRREGIPLSEVHRQGLEALADKLDVNVPWR